MSRLIEKKWNGTLDMPNLTDKDVNQLKLLIEKSTANTLTDLLREVHEKTSHLGKTTYNITTSISTPFDQPQGFWGNAT